MRGEIYRLRTPRDAQGHEQNGVRYCVVVQSETLAQLSTWLIAPTSTNAPVSSFRPKITVKGQSTRVLIDQTTTVDPHRLDDKVGYLTHDEQASVDEALKFVFGLFS